MAEAEKYYLFIDESCHLHHDQSNVISIGFIKVPASEYQQIKSEIKDIKLRYGILHEFKWNTCSSTKKIFTLT